MFTGVNSDKTARALYALLELSKALGSVVDLDQLRKVIAEKAPAVVDAERISLSFHEVSGGKSTPVVDSKGNTIAVLESIGGNFDEHDESLMRALAAHVAAALERMKVTEVHLENAAFEESLRLASEIQMRMLPLGTVDLPAKTRFAIRAHIRPAKQVGGDLYDFFWTDDRLHFCIGDVTGKGIGSALVMAMTKTLFRAHAAFHDDPAKVMSAASARLYEETDPAMFVTAFCGFLDLRDGRLFYSNAGHDRPLILSAGRRVRPFLSKAGLPLGVLPKFNYVAEEKTLREGEALFLYTDGVTEATNGADELFKMDRLCEVLEGCGTADPSQVVPAVLESVDRFAGQTSQADDITMLCVQYRGGQA
jgi:sigma-B regulation protein RsbU (phosphoserine phosphatase)